MEYLYEYLAFLAEVATVTIAIIIVIVNIAHANQRQAGPAQGHLRVEKLNERLKDLRHTMESSLLPADVLKKQHKAEAKAEASALKAEAKAAKAKKPASSAEPETTNATDSENGKARMFVLQFEGDVKASAVEALRTEVSAVLTMATAADEIVVSVESPGGMVHGYGLAASQLHRLRVAGSG